MYPIIIKHILFPLHEFLRGRKTLKYLKELERIQWLSPEEIKEYQWKKLKKLLNHAYQNVPFYRKRFKQLGITPKDIKTPSDFEQFPFLTKEDIRNNLKEMIAKDYKKFLLINSTGGSTGGEPLIFYSDKIREAKQNAAKLRARRWWSIDIGDKELDIWGSPFELSKIDLIRALKDRMLNLIVLSGYDLSEKNMNQYYTHQDYLRRTLDCLDFNKPTRCLW